MIVVSRSKNAAAAGNLDIGCHTASTGVPTIRQHKAKHGNPWHLRAADWVTWSYTHHLCFIGDGSGVRTRTWTVRRPPLSPPAGVAPFAGPVWHALRAASPRARKDASPGRAPGPPRSPGAACRSLQVMPTLLSAAVPGGGPRVNLRSTRGQTDDGHACHGAVPA